MTLAVTRCATYTDLVTWIAANGSKTINGLTYSRGTGFVVIYSQVTFLGSGKRGCEITEEDINASSEGLIGGEAIQCLILCGVERRVTGSDKR